MPTDLSFPPWMLWTAAGLAVVALASFVGGLLRARRQSVVAPSITFAPLQPASKPHAPPMVSGRMPKAVAFMPAPAPLADAPSGEKAEQRASYRRVGNPVLVYVTAVGDHRHPFSAWVIDRSRQGVRLAAEREMTVGATYDVRPVQAPPAAPWVTVEVKHCAKVETYWEAGCQFPKPPAMLVLMLFG
ncbi:MAG: hypothetical protein U0746_22435 [Gemmataceae bacterium]